MMQAALAVLPLLLGLAGPDEPPGTFHDLEGCVPVPAPIPSIDPSQLPGFESCDEEGPPGHFNFCCSGLPDCLPFDCCGCDPGDNTPGQQPDGGFVRARGLDCDIGLIKPRVNFRGVTISVEPTDTTNSSGDFDGDFNFNALPTEDDSRAMLVKGNFEKIGGMHAETPHDWVPKGLFYLDRGDRVDLYGDWGEDCDHDPKIAEIHPFYGLSISRGLSCPRGDQTLGQVFYMAYGPAADGEVTLRVFAPLKGPGSQTLHFSEFLLVEREVVAKQLTPHPEADPPFVEVKLRAKARPGVATGQCESYEPSLDAAVRNLELSYHALVSVWWEGPSRPRPDLVPTLTDACHAKFTVKNAGSVATPATTATVTGAAGVKTVAVPALNPGKSVDLEVSRVLECEGDVTVVVDPDHSIPNEKFDNNTVTVACIC
jgi:hypothetical protein